MKKTVNKIEFKINQREVEFKKLVSNLKKKFSPNKGDTRKQRKIRMAEFKLEFKRAFEAFDKGLSILKSQLKDVSDLKIQVKDIKKMKIKLKNAKKAMLKEISNLRNDLKNQDELKKIAKAVKKLKTKLKRIEELKSELKGLKKNVIELKIKINKWKEKSYKKAK
ncbi:MAG: hypothetical protein GQ574_18095 [Crocinitomix sp.]|nr:hypothetical protein [Crocinitomix sp.]